jgi:hypothetical protein
MGRTDARKSHELAGPLLGTVTKDKVDSHGSMAVNGPCEV